MSIKGCFITAFNKILGSSFIKIPSELTLRIWLTIPVWMILSTLTSFVVCWMFINVYYEDLVFNIYNIIHKGYGIALFWIGILMLAIARGLIIYIFTPKIPNKISLIIKFCYQLFKFASIVFPFFAILFLIVGNKLVADESKIILDNYFFWQAICCSLIIFTIWGILFGATIKKYLEMTFGLSKTRAVCTNLLASLLGGFIAGSISLMPMIDHMLIWQDFAKEYVSMLQKHERSGNSDNNKSRGQ